MTRSSRSKLVFAALSLSLLAVAGSDSQCAKVSDPVSVEESGSRGNDNNGRSECMKQCTRDKKDAKKEEQRRHRDAVRDCDGDSACIQAEAARHSLEMLEIMRAFHECKEHCHEQGGGGGGQ